MGTIADWTSAQQNAATKWRDDQLAANPSITDQGLLDAINVEPVVGTWTIKKNKTRDPNSVGIENLCSQVEKDAGIIITDDLAGVVTKLTNKLSSSNEAFRFAVYLMNFRLKGFTGTVATTEDVPEIPNLTLSDMADLRNL